jgi:hypothetical protein
MKYRNAVLAFAASSALFALAGCGALGGGEGDDGDNGTEGSPVGDEIRSWDPCEVLDNNQPIVDFMQIPEINSPDGKFTSAPYGEGLDAQALTCGGLVIASTYKEELYGDDITNEGEVSVGIIPWDTEEDAELSYEERTGPDQDRRAESGAGFKFTGEEELAGDWDQGKLFVAEDDQSYYYDAYIRDGQWLLWVSIDFNKDNAIVFYEANQDFLDGPLEDYLSYPFTNDELQQWLINEYVPQTHESLSARIPQE